MDLENLTKTSGEWLRGTGPESDIVISSRIRLARNVAAFPFTNRASAYQKAEIEGLLRDRVSRAYGTLCSATMMTSEETMDLLSSVRLGVNMGLLDDVTIGTVNELFIHTQPAHLQKLMGSML